METQLNAEQLKTLMKQAFLEALAEQRELLHDVVMEALEDVAPSRAIEEGMETPSIDRTEIFNLLGPCCANLSGTPGP